MTSHDLITHRNLTLMLTYRCNAQCAECGTFSSPHDKNDITLETAISSIDWAKECGLSQVIFTGGEPSLRWDDLVSCLRHATQLGMTTRLVSNAQWAKTPELAAAGMKQLIDAGLKEINYSTGDEHVRFIPLEHVLNAVQASVTAGMNTALMFELRAKSRIDEQELLARIAALAPKEQMDRHFTFIRSPWMPIRPDNVAEYPDGLYANKKNVAHRRGCESVLSNYVVQGSGKIAPCCGLGMRTVPELQIGSALDKPEGGKNPLQKAIEEGESDLFLYALHKIGPEKIVAWAATKDPSIQWENMYAHRCQACMRIYRDPKVKQVIIDHIQELMAEMVYGGMVLRRFEQLASEALGEKTAGFSHYV
jgi:pyruvate-formate lyase-activating enzyme